MSANVLIYTLKGPNLQLLLSFVKPYQPVSSPTISKWLMIVLNLSGIGTKSFKSHLIRIALRSKGKETGVPTGEILKPPGN